MIKPLQTFGIFAMALGLSAAVNGQVATAWTLPGHHAPIVRGGDGVIRMDAVNAYSHRGTFLWSKGVGGATDMRATTDGRTYISTNLGEVICLDATGTQLWKYRDPALNEKFSSLRVSGNSLWVVGTRPITVGNTTRSGTSYAKFDRLTGSKLHGSDLLLSADSSIAESGVMIAGTATANFVLVKASGPAGGYLGLARMDLDSGALVASTFFLTNREPTALAVDSNNQVYAVDGMLHKFDGNANPTITETWVRPGSTGPVILSKGSIFTRNGVQILKSTPSGDQSAVATVGFPETIEYIAADPEGKIYAMVWAYNYIYPEGLTAYCKVLAFDPDTNQNLWTEVLNPGYEGYAALTTDAWGTVFASGGGKTVALYQYPIPRPDNYTLPGGRPFKVSAPGLMANDGYTDPYACNALKYVGPTHGYLSVNRDGSFVYTPKPGFIGQDSFQYEVVRGIFARTSTVNLIVEHAATLSLSKTEIAGQNALVGTIKLTNVIASSAVITIQDDSTLVTTPASVTVPAGSLAKSFGIQVKPVNAALATTITATYNGVSQAVPLKLLPLIPTAIAFTPNTVTGGAIVSAKVVMNGVAGAGGRTFAVRSSSAAAQPPATITIPAGQSSITFDIPTTTVDQTVLATIRVAATAGEKSATLRINP